MVEAINMAHYLATLKFFVHAFGNCSKRGSVLLFVSVVRYWSTYLLLPISIISIAFVEYFLSAYK